jgi:serine/threonine protein kinase
MSPDVYLEHYRISSSDGGKPVEIARNGPAVTYRAADLKSGAPVALTIVPISSVDPDERERFEEKARTAMLLDHINVAKTIAFGNTEDSFVFVSEYPPGETVDAWVRANGPMPPEAVLRVALQVVAALGAASFHGLTHPAIQPSNLVIVTGKTAEGGWPFVKLCHFGLSGLKSAPRHSEPDVSASDFASPEQLLQGKIDFRSEIYSLGATMCFLLTGVFYSAYPRTPQTKRFARPLRTLVARTLEDDPAERPQDPVLFTEELRACLTAIERRQLLRQRFGIPFSPAVAKPPRKRRIRQSRPTPLLAPIGSSPAPVEKVIPRRTNWRPALAIAAALLVLAAISILLLPTDVVTAAFHRNKPVQTIGVPVGVPDPSPGSVVQNHMRPTGSPIPSPNTVAATNVNRVAIVRSSPAVTQVANSAPAATAAPTPVIAPSAHAVAAQSTAPNDHVGAPSDAETAANRPENSAPGPSDTTVANVSNASAAPTTNSDSTVAASPVEGPSATPAVVAANNVSAEPPPPSESPDENPGGSTNDGIVQDDRNANREEAGPAPAIEEPSSRPPRGSSSSRSSERSHTRKAPVIGERKIRTSRVHERRALPDDHELGPPARGTVRARVVGITPAGNVIMTMPNGEQAIVSAQDAEQYSGTKVQRHRPRRVIIERRTIGAPAYPPYQPFVLPPDA